MAGLLASLASSSTSCVCSASVSELASRSRRYADKRFAPLGVPAGDPAGRIAEGFVGMVEAMR